MRFLFLTTRYSADPADPYMTDELAEGLMPAGIVSMCSSSIGMQLRHSRPMKSGAGTASGS